MGNIIIGNGFLANIFKEIYPNATLLGRNKDVKNSVDTCIVCAPTGNRRIVEKHPEQDLHDVDNILNKLKLYKPKQCVLVSTIDTQINSNSNYAKNRNKLELGYNYNLILRFPTLIHPTIHKNFLYDLKHNRFLNSHNLNSCVQWYNLNDLKKDFYNILNLNVDQYNLVSEPIEHRQIVNRFFKDLDQTIFIGSTVNKYNVTNNGKYHSTKQQIFDVMEEYLL